MKHISLHNLIKNVSDLGPILQNFLRPVIYECLYKAVGPYQEFLVKYSVCK